MPDRGHAMLMSERRFLQKLMSFCVCLCVYVIKITLKNEHGRPFDAYGFAR